MGGDAVAGGDEGFYMCIRYVSHGGIVQEKVWGGNHEGREEHEGQEE